MAVTNHHNDSTYNIFSRVYQWKGSGFVEFQSISTNGAADWEFFTLGGYVQLDTLAAAPPSADCDQPSELGRIKVDTVNNRLYICTNAGWTWTALNLAGGQ